jgi:glyoxylase-like metal-dependent hydrolase (beta-lactamase superfamily II)
MNTWKTNNKIIVWQVLGYKYNVYLIEFGDLRVLVDSGRIRYYNVLTRHLKQKVKGVKTIDYLILTHAHYDHCENAARLKNDWQCKVVASEHESTFLQDGSTPLPRGTTIITDTLVKLGNRFMLHRFDYEPIIPDIEVSNTYAMNSKGASIHLLATPGHSMGSISILVDDEIALVGDTLFGVYRNSVLPPFADNKKELIKSWGMLLEKTNCHTFLPGHGRAISRAKFEQEYLKRTQVIK